MRGVPGGKVNILVGHSIGHSKQKKVCVLFQTVSEVELFLDKKEILRTFSNRSIYCSIVKVHTVYLVQ
jgi:hypothetical protein